MICQSSGGLLIRKAVESDIAAIKDKLRREDEEEVIASGYPSAEAALAQSFERSALRFTAEIKGVPVAMFGLAPESLVGEKAVVWLLGCPEMAKVKKSFVKLSRVIIKEMFQRYPVLFNLVDARYGSTIRWLESCGAEFGPVVKINDKNFVPFTLRKFPMPQEA